MDDSQKRKLLEDLVARDKWSDFLRRFVDVLKINIFVVDFQGHLLIPPCLDGDRPKFGSSFLGTSFAFDFTAQKSNLIEKFQKTGHYWEAKDPFDLCAYAIPIRTRNGTDETIAYMVVGPVILNKKDDVTHYRAVASTLALDVDETLDAINEIRVASFVSIKSILDLLSGVVKDIVELGVEKKKLHQKRFRKEILPKELSDIAQDLYAAIKLDELLVTILDAALGLTGAESGSIMFLDESKKELSIKVSRGIEKSIARKAHQKVGEGLAGIAVKENESFMISGTKGDNRIRHLLKRPDIFQSAVIPLSSQNRVFGVLNLHTKNREGKILENENNLQHFSKLISTAIHSI